ncbi:MAG TPA: flagellar motor protein MotB [Geothrix sp.]
MANQAPFRFARRKADLEGLWLITFADLMVQLMAFFALLYSFSVHDQAKLQQAVTSIQKALGVQSQMPPPAGDGILPGSTGLDPSKASDLEKLLNAVQANEGPDVGTRLRFVSFRGALLFEEGSSALTPGGDVLLARLSQLAMRYEGFTLVCEGHAAPGEKGRGGADALDLSSQRAQSAQRFLARLGLAPARITSEARGDSQPEGDGSTPEGRALQRRVMFRFQRVAER